MILIKIPDVRENLGKKPLSSNRKAMLKKQHKL